MDQSTSESDSLALLSEIWRVLSDAIVSLEGKHLDGGISYVAWGAVHVEKLVSGYLRLRELGHIYASKVMIRPVMETTFSVVAAQRDSGFLFRKAYSEYLEDKKLINEERKLLEGLQTPTENHAVGLGRLSAAMAAIEQGFISFEQNFAQLRPQVPRDRVAVSVYDSAGIAKLSEWYGQYRTYCQFTHGALRAIVGDFNKATNLADNRVMVWLALIRITTLKTFAPINAPDLEPYWKRANMLLS